MIRKGRILPRVGRAVGAGIRTLDGAGIRIAYDGAGRRIAATNTLGQVTWTAYDSEDRVIATWGATYPVAYEFDAFGRMVAMVTTRDPAQESVNLLTLLPTGGSLSESSVAALDVTRWVYDAATGLMTSKVYADDKGPSYTYTSDGKLSRRTWARGATTDYTYDASGALTGIDYSGATPDVTFSYDRLGRQVRISDGTGGRTNVYDASTLDLIEERLPDGSALARSQDSFGRASGIALGTAYDVNYGFDTSGRFGALTSTVGSVQSAFAYSYVPDSDLLAGWAVGGGISFRRIYESSRDLIATVTNTWNGTALGTFGYENDAIARRTKRVDSGVTTNAFGYNLRSEVASAIMGTNVYGYGYDPIGNRRAATNNAQSLAYAANGLNQYTNIVDGGTVVPTYDDDGNMTGFGTWTYTWDGENRLAIATDGSTAVTNGYDSMSRRVAKGTASETRRFAYDAWNPVRETVDAGGTLSTNFYVWGLDLSQTLQGAGGVGGLLSVVRGDAPYFTGYDANGNVTDYASANGMIVAHYEFDPFGNTTAATGSVTDAFAHRFSTKYWDSETELYYYGLRFYRPDMGRWISIDPLGERGGANLLAAFMNTPLTRVDPHGANPLIRILSDPSTPDIFFNLLTVLEEFEFGDVLEFSHYGIEDEVVIPSPEDDKKGECASPKDLGRTETSYSVVWAAEHCTRTGSTTEPFDRPVERLWYTLTERGSRQEEFFSCTKQYRVTRRTCSCDAYGSYRWVYESEEKSVLSRTYTSWHETGKVYTKYTFGLPPVMQFHR